MTAFFKGDYTVIFKSRMGQNARLLPGGETPVITGDIMWRPLHYFQKCKYLDGPDKKKEPKDAVGPVVTWTGTRGHVKISVDGGTCREAEGV